MKKTNGVTRVALAVTLSVTVTERPSAIFKANRKAMSRKDLEAVVDCFLGLGQRKGRKS